MAATSRVHLALLTVAILAGAAPSHAQDAPEAQANESGAVGPRELENFNLPGTVTRPSEPQPAPTPRRQPPAATATQAPATATTAPGQRRAAPPRETASAEQATNEPRQVTAAPRAQARPPVTMQLPPLSDSPTAAPREEPAATLPAAPPPGDVPWPWMLAAGALLAGAGAYWWLNRTRAAAAGGPSLDAFSGPPAPAPEPAPAPAPAPPVPPTADPAAIGIVSTRLRPWVEIDIKPLRCIVTEDHVAIDVELTLFNSGSLPARSILLEAAMLNAGPSQDHDIEYFFSNPIGSGKRASSLPPLKKAVVRSRVMTPLKDAQQYEIEGRMVYVPLVAVNAIYSWPAGEGQTAGAYIVGRETQGEKLAPFRLDRGAAAYEPVGRRQLPNGTRV